MEITLEEHCVEEQRKSRIREQQTKIERLLEQIGSVPTMTIGIDDLFPYAHFTYVTSEGALIRGRFHLRENQDHIHYLQMEASCLCENHYHKRDDDTTRFRYRPTYVRTVKKDDTWEKIFSDWQRTRENCYAEQVRN